MFVTELGIVIDVNAEHPWNAEEPILVTELGIVTDVNAVHPWNAEEPILVTELGIITCTKLVEYGTVVEGIEVVVSAE